MGTHGKNTVIYYNGYTLTTYFSSIDTSGKVDTVDTSTFGSSDKTYVVGLKDGTVAAEGFYDGSTDAVDEVLAAAFGSADGELCVYLNGDTAGNTGKGLVAIASDYSISTTIDGAVTTAAAWQANDTAIEKLVSIMALTAVSASGSSASHDNGASSANGGAVYLQSTDVTTAAEVEVIVEHSANDADWTTLASFTAVDTDHTSERVTFSGTVNQYTRVTYTLEGGETLTLQVGLHRA